MVVFTAETNNSRTLNFFVGLFINPLSNFTAMMVSDVAPSIWCCHEIYSQVDKLQQSDRCNDKQYKTFPVFPELPECLNQAVNNNDG